MDNNKGIKLAMTVKWPDDQPTTVTYESGYPDETLENIIHGFVTCLVGQTWMYQTVINGLKEYVEEHDESPENQD